MTISTDQNDLTETVTSLETPPAQEWCDSCALSDDPAIEPGMAQTVIDHTIETLPLPESEWDPSWGPGPLYEVTHLACGHTLSWRC